MHPELDDVGLAAVPAAWPILSAEDRFARVVEASPTALVLVGAAGQIEMVNRQAERMFGYDRADLQGKKLEVLLPERFRSRHVELRNNFLSNMSSRLMGEGRDLFGKRSDGTEFPLEIGLNPIDLDGEPMVLAGIIDVTARRQAEQEREAQRRLAEDRFARMVEASPTALVLAGAAGRIEMVNRGAEQMFGYGRAELAGQDLEVLLPERFRARHVGLRNNFLANMSSRMMGEGRALFGLRKDCTEFPLEIGLNPIDLDGEPMVLAGIIDISARREAENEREEQRRLAEDRFARMVEASPTALVLASAAGRIEMVNSRAERMFGYDRAELAGRELEVLLPQRYRNGHIALRTDFLTDMSSRMMGEGRDLFGLRKDGIEFALEIGLNPIELDGESMVLAGIIDVTARRQAEREKEKQRHELERSNADLEEFAYVASHDLKAPLRAIAHLARWIGEDVDATATPETLDNLKLLQGRVARLQMLLDGLLAYSRIGRTHSLVEDVDIADTVHDIVAALSPPPGFVVTCEGPMGTLRTHRTPIQRVLENLISNALKHHDHPEGRITVTMRKADGMAEINVTDDGPGIPPRYHDRIFVIFQTLESRDVVESSGIGLAIVKKKVQSHGGQIRVQSAPPARGASFIFTWQEATA